MRVTVTDSANLTAAATFNWTVTNAGPASVTATEFLNATTALPNSVTSTGVNPVEQLYIEDGHLVELKLNAPIAVPSGLALTDIQYRIGNSPAAPKGTFGPTNTVMFTPSFPSAGVYPIVYVGVDLGKNGSISANEETQKLEIRRLEFIPAQLEVKAQRVAPTALKENLFPVKEGEMFETDGLITSLGVPLPSQFRFGLTGPNMGDSSLIRWELRRPDTTIILAGNGNSFPKTISTPEPLQVRFFLDRNNNTNKEASEPEIVSATFNVVAPVTHSLTFKFSSLLTIGAVGFATPAQRLTAAQSLADAEDDVLQIKEHPDDWRTPVKFSLTSSAAGGVFIVSAARPDERNATYDSNLHIAAPHDITFTKWMTTCGGGPAIGCTGSTGSVILWSSPLTFVHELGHLYGRVDGWPPGDQGHTPKSLEYDGYLMHPGHGHDDPADVGEIGGILEKEDAERFYLGNKI